MKKTLIAAVVSAIMLLSSFTAFAQNLIEIESITVSDEEFTVNFTTTGLEEDDQITILTLKTDSPEDIPTAENIKYINQADKGANTDIKFSLNSASDGIYQIKMGGTDISSPALMSVSLDSKMDATKNFDGNPIYVFSDELTLPDKVKNENGNLFILRPEKRYVSAYASAPGKEGYEIKEYGIRINGENKSAKVALTDKSKFGMLFYGSGITAGADVVIFPYVTYQKIDSDETITYFGNAQKATLADN